MDGTSSKIEKMNSLARLQEDLGKEICRLQTNCKKDSSSRKTDAYIQRIRASLSDLWKQVKMNHTELEKFNSPEHAYFSTKYYEQISARYEETMKYLAECPKASSDDRSDEIGERSGVVSAVNSEILTKQKFKVERFEKTLEKINEDLKKKLPLSHYGSLEKRIQDIWNEVKEIFNETLTANRYITEDDFLTMENDFYDTVAILENRKEKVRTSEPDKANIVLPKVTLPTFDGGYIKWATFDDIFVKMIHDNNRLTNVEKMQYLKTHIRGEPEKLIQHLHILDGNYETAWELLQRRYKNKRLLVNNMIDRILDLPVMLKESVAKLRQLHDITVECLEGIKNQGIDSKDWGPILERLISRKWDTETNKLYEQSLTNPHEVQDLQNMLSFLERRFLTLEASMSKKNSKDQEPKTTATKKCACCDGDHPIYFCQKFKAQRVNERAQFIKNKQLCVICLSHNASEKCNSTRKCTHCSKNHNTLLHREQTNERKSAQNVSNQTSATTSHVVRNPDTVLLATALVKTTSHCGMPQMLRVLIDQGSQSSFITEEVAQLLGLPREKIKAEICGLGDGSPKTANWKMQTELKPRFSSDFRLTVDLLILKKLTQTMPSSPLPKFNNKFLKNVVLADPNFNKPGPIDILLGANEYGKLILNGLKKSQDGLIGQNTEFGWILSGHIKESEPRNIQIKSMVSWTEEDNQLTKFWEIEEGSKKDVLSEDDQICDEFYNNTTQRLSDGTYVVRVPFKEPEPTLGISKPRAAARLLQLEKRLTQNNTLKSQYLDFMKEYLELGHMEKVPLMEYNKGGYYIPHQAVIRESSSTTKLRVVFDASSKSTTNISLNDTMYVGPRLQQDLSDILLRWRKHKIAFTADIEKMYRQIKIHPDDQYYQRILWRFTMDEPIQEYKLTTVTYGTASAPYLAVKTLFRLAEDNKKTYPLAADVATTDFYVDDVLSGADNIENATKLQTQLIDMLKSGGFNLRKWSSNNTEILQSLPDNLKDQSTLQIRQDELKKSLGVLWNPVNDTFQFKVSINKAEKITKRYILSEIAKLFDPLGWLAPIIIKAKLMIQQLWLQQLDWDQIVNPTIIDQWKTFREQIKLVESIKIPRWMQVTNSTVEIHGFCDASEKAYGAVVYSCAKKNGETKVTLLYAKSKVAPIKLKTTLPRLELCAAVLLANILSKTIKALNYNNVTSYAWSDSMITLGWIKGDTNRWKTFVANRVAEITNLIPPEKWNHVSTTDNPADAISRGMDPEKLVKYELWWQGPKWLAENKDWPKSEETYTSNLEVKKCFQVVVNVNHTVIDRFSNLDNMVRVLSYCRRFIRKLQHHIVEETHLTFIEMHQTLVITIKMVQSEAFKLELIQLDENKKVDKSSKILNLNPFLDNEKILRVGGRLENSALPFNQKHPIIVPSNCQLTKMIIQDAHRKTLHGGIELTLAYIRRKYWIINGKKAVRSYIQKCIICIRYKAKTAEQLMGQLPEPRITPSAPFTHTGVDYAGPIQIRTTKGRGHKSYKGYISIFVCLSTKAIHLEVVSDMTTDSFLAAFRRFVSRRGTCSNMYSDNGTNFVGAARILEDELSHIVQHPDIQNTMATSGVSWHFIPPAAPHFGGLWEAGVKSMKHHLKRVIGNSTLTFEELVTLTHQIEACLNSRPLYPMGTDTNEFTALTPGHFLIGRAIISPPDPINTDINSNMQQRWKLIQKMKKDFWKAWTSEYLSKLQQRYKWQTTQDNLNLDRLVLIKEDNINPSKWPLARIVQLHPAKDGNVRVVTLRRAEGSNIKRPIHTLIPLPTNNPSDSSSPQHQTKTSTNYAQTRLPSKSTQKMISKKTILSIFMLLFVSRLVGIGQAGYSIQHPKNGLYVEHLGYAQLEKGTFKMEIHYNKSALQQDSASVHNVTEQFEKMCNQSRALSEEIYCNELVHHLREMENYFEWIKGSLHEINYTRRKRGLLGRFLTSMFGVNDEVYQDINELDKNQKELIKTAHHQTKIMISSMSQINDTEVRIANQLGRFRTKLNQALQVINEMQRWYKAVDINKLSIHTLSTYHVAANYITEVCNQYTKLTDVEFNRGTIFDVIPPAQIRQSIEAANEKLPSQLQIIRTPSLRTSIQQNDTIIKVFGYFLIVDTSDFTMMRVTPIPLDVKESSYWTLDVSNNILAADYNKQLYFQLSQDEFSNSIVISDNRYACSPAVVKNMEANPNCIVDQIYNRPEPTPCKQKQQALRTIIWKQLHMPNTWLFVTNKPTPVAITCNGVREDVYLNTTGIIRITQDCLIETKQNLLAPKRVVSSPVLASYFRPVNVKFVPPSSEFHTTIVKEEPVLRTSDVLTDLKNDEDELEQQLREMNWKKVTHHSLLTSSITTVLIIVILFTILGVWWLWRRQENRSNQATRREPDDNGEVFELQPLG